MVKIGLKDAQVQEIKSRKTAINKLLINWGKKSYRHFPWRENRTAYSVLISEVLLKRTTASAVKNVYGDFMSLYPNINELINADCGKLEVFLSRLGYHKIRTKILIEMAKYIIEKYGGQIPKSKEELLDIPYVGNYTANAVLSFCYNVPVAIVDTNVERIIKRVFLKCLPNKISFKLLQEVADTLSPKSNTSIYNYALLDFGGLVCKSGLPKCRVCPIKDVCDYYLLGKPQSKTI